MANAIDFLKDTKTVTSSTSSTSSETQTTKDKPSLFDSLLTNSNQIETKVATVDEVPQNKETPAVVKEENKVEVKIEDNKNSRNKSEEVNTKATDVKKR
ncbi:MAG: hypothetical protein U5K55_10920 [Aliarcobacter sp.]|nr:hypothetical protein [Aliarcobacter sp.]